MDEKQQRVMLRDQQNDHEIYNQKHKNALFITYKSPRVGDFIQLIPTNLLSLKNLCAS